MKRYRDLLLGHVLHSTPLCVGMLSGIISSGAMYHKSLSLDQKTLGKFSLGNIISLVSNDVRKLDFVSCILATTVL